MGAKYLYKQNLLYWIIYHVQYFWGEIKKTQGATKDDMIFNFLTSINIKLGNFALDQVYWLMATMLQNLHFFEILPL